MRWVAIATLITVVVIGYLDIRADLSVRQNLTDLDHRVTDFEIDQMKKNADHDRELAEIREAMKNQFDNVIRYLERIDRKLDPPTR